MSAMITLYTDGSIQPVNPGGYACYGFAAWSEDGALLHEGWGHIGQGALMTNNLAEYTAVVEALQWAYRAGYRRALVRSDSQLIVGQCSGRMRAHAPGLVPLWERVQRARAVMTLSWEWIPRAQNSHADALSRRAYIEHISKETDKP